MGSGIARLVTIPRVGQRTAEVIVAQTGGDMTRSPNRGPAGRLGRAGAQRQPVRRQAQEGPHPHGRRAPAHRHGRSSLGHLAHRHPPRRPVPPPRPPVRQGQPEQGRRAVTPPCCTSPGGSCATTATCPSATSASSCTCRTTPFTATSGRSAPSSASPHGPTPCSGPRAQAPVAAAPGHPRAC